MENKNKTITQTVLQVNKIVNKSLISQSSDYSFWVIFDKELQPYWVSVSPISRDEMDKEDALSVLQAYQLQVYSINRSSTEFSSKNLVAECKYFIEENRYKLPYANLLLIYVNKKRNSNKGLATELFNIMDLQLSEQKVKKIRGVAAAFKYTKMNDLLAFYKRKYFRVIERTMTTTILKRVSQKDVDKFKLRVMNFPTKALTYTVAVPQSLIAKSGINNNINNDVKTKNQTLKNALQTETQLNSLEQGESLEKTLNNNN